MSEEKPLGLKKVVATSGGFDPIHIGHLRCFQEARKLGDYLIVILNDDNWLKRKKGRIFMTANERSEIIKGFGCVDDVLILQSERDDVIDALELLKPNVFAKGGDRTAENTPEKEFCEKNGIEIIYGIGGEKIRSSSELLDNYCNEAQAKKEKT